MAKLKLILKAVKKVYGRGVKDVADFNASPYHGKGEIDHIELLLHELGHRMLLPKRTPKKTDNAIGNYIEKLPSFRANIHEIKAVAIECLVAEALGVPIKLGRVWPSALDNLELVFSAWDRETNPKLRRRLRSWFKRAMNLASVKRQAELLTQEIKSHVNA